MDETYAEDSFVVGSDEEEEEEEGGNPEEAVDLVLEDSYVDGRKQYSTRRRALLHHMRSKAGSAGGQGAGPPGAGHQGLGSRGAPKETAEANGKRSRIVRIQDSSEEEGEGEEEEGKKGGDATVVKDKRDDDALFRPPAVPRDLRLDKRPRQQNASLSSAAAAAASSSSLATKISHLSRKMDRPSSEHQFGERYLVFTHHAPRNAPLTD